MKQLEDVKRPKVSVCMPIYNGEKYIEKCVCTLFSQTLDDMEYVFVNDCTPDASMDIVTKVLEQFPHRKSQVKIINHDSNQGIAISNRDALLATTGEYVITCDDDDWVEPEMYEKLYNLAKQKDADIACCDYYKEYSDERRERAISHYEGTWDERVRSWIELEYKAYSWVTMVRGDIYRHQVKYAAQGYAEDCVRACQVQYLSKRYVYLAEPMYHYRAGGLSSKPNIKLIRENLKDYEWIFSYFQQKGDSYNNEINTTKLLLKLNLCIRLSVDFFYSYWPEVNNWSVIRKSHLPMKHRICAYLLAMRLKYIFEFTVYVWRKMPHKRDYL